MIRYAIALWCLCLAPTQAMLLGGLEEAPYTGWTLTNMETAEYKLLLGGAVVDDLDGTTSFSKNSGADATVDFNRLLFEGASDYSRTMTDDGNFDIRVDYDFSALPGGTDEGLELRVVMDTDYVSILTNGDGGFRFERTGGTSTATSGTKVPFGTMRLTRVGNVFRAYHRNPQTLAWVEVGSGTTQAGYATAVDAVHLITSGTGVKVHCDNFRSTLPTDTSGTAVSPVFDTTTGLRGVGWFTTSGTGAVTVEYRVGPTQLACLGASWQTAASWQPLVHSLDSRYAQVRVTVTGGSTSAASPEIGPVLGHGELTVADSQLLVKRLLASAQRHTDSNYDIAFNDEPSEIGWGRYGIAAVRFTEGAGSVNMTWQGETWDVADHFIEGLNRCATSAAAQSFTSTAKTAMYAYWLGRDTLLPLTSSGYKTAIATACDNPSIPQTNFRSFRMLIRSVSDTLDDDDPSGPWTAYSDAFLDTDYEALADDYLGNGVWDDTAEVDQQHIDVYSTVLADTFAAVHAVRPAYEASDISAKIRAHAANLRHLTDDDGASWTHGRSIHAGTWVTACNYLSNAEALEGSDYACSQEVYTRAFWSYLRWCHQFGFDFTMTNTIRVGSEDAQESYGDFAVITGGIAGGFANHAYSGRYESVAHDGDRLPASGLNAWAWPGAQATVTKGVGINDPTMSHFGITHDDLNTYVTKYATWGLQSGRFSKATYVLSSARPTLMDYTWYSRVPAVDSVSIIMLTRPSSTLVVHCGRGTASVRSGNGYDYETDALVASVDMDEVLVCYQHHAQSLARIASSNAISFTGIKGLPVPTSTAYNSEAWGDEDSGTSPYWHYGYMAEDQGPLGSLIVDLTGTFTSSTAISPLAHNTENYRGISSMNVALTATSPATTEMHATDLTLQHNALDTTAELAWIGSFTADGNDGATYLADDDGNPVNVFVDFDGATNPTPGSWTLTGTVQAFQGDASGTWGGGAPLTAIAFSGQTLLALASAGNASFDVVSTTKTKLWFDGASQLTIQDDILPSGFNRVYAVNFDGSRVDVTSGCTMGPTSIVVPVAAVSSYDFGLVALEVENVDLASELDQALRALGSGSGGTAAQQVDRLNRVIKMRQR